MALALATAFLLFSSNLAAAQGATTGGTLTLASTFDCISVRVTFTGDDNANNSATIQYRVTGSSRWLDAYPPMTDRRATIGGSANPYVNQFRGSIVGLSAGTSYDVQVTFSDVDGVTGGPTVSGSVSTISATVPGLTGTDRYATNDGTLATALAAAQPGDTIHLAAGTYSPFTLSKSGTAANWIALIGADRDTTFINGGGTSDLVISANYVQVKNLRFHLPGSDNTDYFTIHLSANQHHIWLDNLYFEDLYATPGSSTTGYNNAHVYATNGNHHVYILNSFFHAPSLSGNANKNFNAGGNGIHINGTPSAEGTWVIKGNVFDGRFRDSIGNSREGLGNDTRDNTDIANNTVTNFVDDGIQMEGDDINLRMWGNVVTLTNGNSCLATESSYIGPVYMFRNVLVGGTPFKIGGAVYTFAFHNTVDGTSDALAANATTMGWVVRNNILKDTANGLYCFSSAGASTFDYNLYSVGGQMVRHWYPANVDYATPAAFYAGAGQEQHGRSGNPLFTDSAKHIDATSPAYNAGVALANFNGADSAWPYSGTAPDLGAYIVVGPQVPAAPTNVQVIR